MKTSKILKILKWLISISIIMLPTLAILFYSLNAKDIKNNIAYAMENYNGSAEEALIGLLLDENTDPETRTHKAIWTLGQLDSQKALPILNELYTNDPEGKSCYGHHDELLCQYEIHKAIRAIEGRMLFRYKRLLSYKPEPGTSN